MNNRIYLFLPYYGPFKNYFQYFLNSLEKNTDTLTVFLITDEDMSTYRLPENCKLVHMSLNEIRERLQRFLRDEYAVNVDYNLLLKDPYKLCDVKPIYSVLFEDFLIKANVSENDYVGFGDTDLIYGKISNFIDLSKNYVGFGLNGHLTATKNTDEIKKHYKAIKNYAEILQNKKFFLVDEKDFTKQFKKLHESVYLNIRKYLADILPYVFLPYGNDFPAHWLSHFAKIDSSDNPWKTIKTTEQNKHLFGNLVNELYLVNYKESEGRFKEKRIATIESTDRLIVHFEDGDSIERIYAHFLRRPMELTSAHAATNFYVKNNSFYNI